MLTMIYDAVVSKLRVYNDLKQQEERKLYENFPFAEAIMPQQILVSMDSFLCGTFFYVFIAKHSKPR